MANLIYRSIQDNYKSRKRRCFIERSRKHQWDCQTKNVNVRDNRKTPCWTSKNFVATLQFEKHVKHEEGEKEAAKKQNGSKQKTSKIKRLVHKLVSTTFMATHNSCNSKVWCKI